jgi:PDZ domain-containing protein
VTLAPRLSRLWWFAGPVLALLVGAVVVIAALPVPYVTLSPGGARSVEPLVTIASPDDGTDLDLEQPTDNLLYVTVSTTVEPSGILVLRGLFDDKVQVEPSAPFLGTQTRDESRALNLALMTDSQDKARKVALERLGYEVETEATGAFLEDVDPDLPAGEVLRPGMTIVGADGREVRTRDDLVEAIEAREPGDTMELEVERLGERTPETVRAELVERPGEPGSPILGISPVDRATYQFPIDIRIDTGRVGGPSAGLAFTLAILDRLTPGRLTGEDRVAVTGTIELDGSVGPVGGVRHKTEAAIREGAKVFLVPPDEFDLAVEAADGRIDIEAVATLDDALEALAERGGSGLPPT